MENNLNNVCNEAFFERLFRKYFPEIRNFLLYKFGENFLPEDKAQEAFIKLWENCKEVSPDKVRGYLYKVAGNLSLNEVKHAKVVLNYQQSAATDETAETPLFQLEEKEFMERYQKALEKLSVEQRTAFLMARAEGMSHQEIAQVLGITLRAVRKRIYTALDNLRKEIKEL